MKKYTIVFDIGGLFIKSAVMNALGKLVPDSYMVYPAKSKESKEALLLHFVELIKQQTNRIMDKTYRIDGIGYAFPGPFDYEEGISYIRGVDKFDEIYGVNLRDELSARLANESWFAGKRSPDFHIVFENDANLFALGEYAVGKAGAYEKALCLTIGTGAGSAFLEGGELVKYRQDVPEHGWIYNQPFGDSIVDDYVSKRGIVRLMREAGLDDGLDVKNVAEMAHAGDEKAIGVFHRFGDTVGEMLLPFIRSFRPDAVIIGGQIVKSKDLFLDRVREALSECEIALEATDDTSLSAFAGVSILLAQRKKAKAREYYV
ncbi:ROK family protein [Paenibacillaceae bacterium WGS1546]|uniref:ROK family protein n=1 Tax=Cohnella sp. WGS1546 TaxID=3366810 RepID=UPI00372D857B